MLSRECLWSKIDNAHGKQAQLPRGRVVVQTRWTTRGIDGELSKKRDWGVPKTIVGRATTSAGERLFDVREETEARPVEEEFALAFHHTTAGMVHARVGH